MALTFKTAALIEVIDGIVAAHHSEQERVATDKIKARAAHERKWIEQNTPRVRALRDYLTKSLKSGVPPTTAEARRIMEQLHKGSGSNGVYLFAEGGEGDVVSARNLFYRLDELEGMAELLRAHTEPTVTAHQLKELGTHQRDLEKLFRAATVAKAVAAAK